MVFFSRLIILLSLGFAGLTPALCNRGATQASGSGCAPLRSSDSLFPYLEALRDPGKDAPAEVKEIVNEILRTYAPLIWWHPEEKYEAMDPLEFIARSSLWRGVKAPRKIAEVGQVEARDLGVGRPASGTEYFLRYESRKPRGQIRAPMLWKLGEAPVCGARPDRRQLLIEYWYHSAHNETAALGLGNHQGDWEGIGMWIDLEAVPSANGGLRVRHRLRAAFFAAHEDGRWACPEDLLWTEGPDSHLEAFSALGTHATYRSPGRHSDPIVADETAKGKPWESWRDLRPLVLEPYYGFAGRWGEPRWLSFMNGPRIPGPGFKPQPKRGFREELLPRCSKRFLARETESQPDSELFLKKTLRGI